MPHTDNCQTKVGPTYDSIRTQLLINNQQRTWEMIQHISTVEIASLAAWYYLYDKQEYLMSGVLMVLSILIVYCLFLAITRYTDLMRAASASLSRSSAQGIYLGEGAQRRFEAAHITRLIPVVILFFNFFVLIFSFCKSSQWL